MRSIKRLLVVAGAIAALTVLAPAALAESPKDFHLTKTCVSDFLCTVQSSDFKAIPPGTDITYLYGEDPSLAYPTITVANGSTTGVCDWNQPGPTVLAICTFGTGTGRLSEFNLVVDVSTNDDQSVWFWDGTYSFGG